jgi:hypothetical protein
MKSDKPIHYATTAYGFEWGAAKIIRISSDQNKGWVVIGLRTPRKELQIDVTRTGKIRISNCKTNGELKEEKVKRIPLLKREVKS